MKMNAVEKGFSDKGTKKADRDINPCRLSFLTINCGVALDPYLNHSVEPRDIR